VAFQKGQSGNPGGRPKGINRIKVLRSMIDVPALLETLRIAAADGDVSAAKLLLERALPALKLADSPVTLPLGDGLAEQGRLVMDGIHKGTLTPDQAQRLMSALAAERAGLDDVPCWVREMTDEEAYMQLVLCNTQSELHPLEIGKHAVESGQSMSAYAKNLNLSNKNMTLRSNAYEVYTVLPYRNLSDLDGWTRLAEIHAAPEWLWPAMVAQMIEGEWTASPWGDKEAACEKAGLNFNSAKKCGWVADVFEFGQRLPNLHFSHHASLSIDALTPDQRAALLSDAVENKWSAARLWREVSKEVAQTQGGD
jgi:hypothetical protein